LSVGRRRVASTMLRRGNCRVGFAGKAVSKCPASRCGWSSRGGSVPSGSTVSVGGQYRALCSKGGVGDGQRRERTCIAVRTSTVPGWHLPTGQKCPRRGEDSFGPPSDRRNYRSIRVRMIVTVAMGRRRLSVLAGLPPCRTTVSPPSPCGNIYDEAAPTAPSLRKSERRAVACRVRSGTGRAAADDAHDLPRQAGRRTSFATGSFAWPIGPARLP